MDVARFGTRPSTDADATKAKLPNAADFRGRFPLLAWWPEPPGCIRLMRNPDRDGSQPSTNAEDASGSQAALAAFGRRRAPDAADPDRCGSMNYATTKPKLPNADGPPVVAIAARRFPCFGWPEPPDVMEPGELRRADGVSAGAVRVGRVAMGGHGGFGGLEVSFRGESAVTENAAKRR